MLTMDTTQHTQVVAGVAWLAELHFTQQTFRVSTAPRNITSGGHVWTGLGALGSVSAVSESADSRAEQLTLGLVLADPSMLALAPGNTSTYRGRPVRLYLQLFDESFQPAGSPRLRWAGVMNKVQIPRRPAEPERGSDASGSIDMVCSRSGMARARNREGLRLTDAQQQLRYPGDTGLRYVRELIDKPVQWLSKAFQER